MAPQTISRNASPTWPLGHSSFGGEFSLLADYKQRAFEEYRTPDFKNYLNLYLMRRSTVISTFIFYFPIMIITVILTNFILMKRSPVPVTPTINGFR